MAKQAISKIHHKFKPSAAAETRFNRALRKIARASGHLVEAHVDGHTIKNPREMRQALENYSKLIEPWAIRQSQKMLEQVSKKNDKAYRAKSTVMGNVMRSSVAEADVGVTAFKLMQEQVELIKSIPLRAAERAQKLAFEAIFNGSRASEIAKDLMRTTEVSESDATRIARTEVARSNASITQARAAAAGALGYVWRTTMDGAERESHRKMNGKIISYDKIPTLSDGTIGHAGNFINCRCYQDPIF